MDTLHQLVRSGVGVEGYNLVMELQNLGLILLALRHLVASHLGLGVHRLAKLPLQARNLLLELRWYQPLASLLLRTNCRVTSGIALDSKDWL